MRSFGLQQDFVLALGAVFLLWLGVAVYIVLARALHDARDALIRTAQHLLERGLDEALSEDDPAAIERALSRLPAYAIERVAADSATPAALAGRFAVRALELRRERLRRAASSRRSGRSNGRRIVALRIFGAAGDASALPLLAAALEDPDEEIAAAAAAVLGGFPAAAAGELLVGALLAARAPAPMVAAQIDRSRLDLHELIRPLCDNNDPDIRRWAAVLLARYPEHGELSLELAVLAGDANADVRAAAVHSLARFRSPAALGAALALLDDEVWYVRVQAARTLAAQERPEFAPLLTRLLADERWWVRTAAKEALEELGEGASEALVDALEQGDEFARNGAAEVLQNTGAIDRLVAAAAADPADMAALRTLHRVFTAGGERIAGAALERVSDSLDPETADLIRRVERSAASAG